MTDSNLNEELALTVQLLAQSYTSKDNSIQQTVLIQLEELAKNPLRHIQILLKAFTLHSTEVTMELKQSIAIRLRNQLQLTQNKIPEAHLLDILRLLLKLLVFNEVPLSSIKHLHDIIISIASTNLFISDISHINNILVYLHQTLAQASKEDFLNKGLAIITLLNVFLQSKSINNESMGHLMKIITDIIDHVFSIVGCYINLEHGIDFNFLNVLKATYDSLYSLLIKIKGLPVVKKLCNVLFEKYGSYSSEIITLTMNNTNQNNIIYLTDSTQLNDSINALKGKALQFLTGMIQISDSLFSIENCVIICSSLVQSIAQSLQSLIASNHNLILSLIDSTLKNGLHCILYSMMVFLSRVLIRSPLKDKFAPCINEFIINILFPLLLSSSEDVYRLKDAGEEYYKFMNDLIQLHRIKTYRTAAVSLLQKICENYPESFFFVSSFTLQYLTYTLKANDNESSTNSNDLSIDIGQYYYLVKHLKQNSVLEALSIERRIDFCLLIMLILNNKVLLNKQYTEMLRSLLLTYSSVFFNSDHPLVLDKLCLFYSYFTLPLFNDPSEENFNYVSSVFSFLMTILLDYSKFPGLVFQSANTILDLLNDKNKEQRLVFTDIINANLERMIGFIEGSEVHIFFDILILIVSRTTVSFGDILFNRAANRLLKELQIKMINSTKENRVLDKCFTMLTVFLKNNIALANTIGLIKSIEQLLRPIACYILEPKKFDYEDDIINLIKAFIVFSQQVTEFSASIVPSLHLVCNKSREISETEFSFMCEFFKYDKDSQFTQLHQKSIIDLIYFGYQYDTKNRDGPIISLMITLQLLSKEILIETEALEALLLKAYQISFEQGEIKNSSQIINYQCTQLLSVSVIAISMTTKPYATLSFLENENFFISFLMTIETVIKSSFYSERLFKIIIIGLCTLINDKTCMKKLALTSKLKQLLYLLFKLCSMHKTGEKNCLSTIVKEDPQCNEVSMTLESSNGNSDDEEDDHGKYRAKQAIGSNYSEDDNAINIYIKQNYIEMIAMMYLLGERIDEYISFTQSMNSLDGNYYQNFSECLSNDEKRELNELYHIQKVDISFNNKTLKTPRRIVSVVKENTIGARDTSQTLSNTNSCDDNGNERFKLTKENNET